ncbi:hypothetical protein TNCV_4046401 [Trichonephila clavipes]|nr:hypothetical protein TNCV_4046401 [Trichonephila clavipes]
MILQPSPTRPGWFNPYLVTESHLQLLSLKLVSFVPRYQMKAASQEALQEVVTNSFQLLYERWLKCIVTQEDYFGGDMLWCSELFKYIVTFVIPLDKLQEPFQEKFKVLPTEKVFNGFFDFSIASKAHSGKILPQRKNQRKLVGARSGLCGWCRRSQPRVAIYFCNAVTECGLTLSSNDGTIDLRKLGQFFRITSFDSDQGVTIPCMYCDTLVPTSIKSTQNSYDVPVQEDIGDHSIHGHKLVVGVAMFKSWVRVLVPLKTLHKECRGSKSLCWGTRKLENWDSSLGIVLVL